MITATADLKEICTTSDGTRITGNIHEYELIKCLKVFLKEYFHGKILYS